MSVCLTHYFFTMGISKQSAFHSCSQILGLPEIAAFCTFYEAVSKPIYRSKMSGNSKMQSSETWLETRKVKCWCPVTALKPADNSFWISNPWSDSSTLRWGLSLTQSHTEIPSCCTGCSCSRTRLLEEMTWHLPFCVQFSLLSKDF